MERETAGLLAPPARRRLAALVAAALGSLVLAACGSSSNDSSSSSGDSSASGGGSSQVVMEAASAVEKATAPITEWPGPTEPTKAVADQKVGIITCGAFENCIRMGKGVEDAAKALGWPTVKFDPTLYTPAEFNGAVQRMLDQGVTIIADAGATPRSVFGPGLAATKKKGAIFVSLRAGSGGAADVEVGDPPEEFQGKIAADYFINDSKGNAEVVSITDNEYLASKAADKGLQDELSKCSGCKFRGTTDVIGAKYATDVAPETISLLRRNPKVKYIFAAYDGQARLAAQAAKQIGRSDVIVIGTGGEKASREQILSGTGQTGTVSLAQEWNGWALMDVALRLLNKQPPADHNLPWQLTLKSNADHQFTGDLDYQSEYKKLWGVGS